MRPHVRLRLLIPTLIAAVVTCHAARANAQTEEPQKPGGGRPATLVYAARNAPAASLADSLQPLATRGGVSMVVEPVSNHLIISGAAAAIGELTDILKQIDRTPSRIETQLLIVELADAEVELAEADFEEHVAAISKLQAAGAVSVLNRIRLTTLDNQQAQVQVGRQVAVVSGENVGRGRFFDGRDAPPRRTPIYQMGQEGMVVVVTPRATTEGTIQLQLSIEESRFQAQAPASADDPDSDAFVPPTKVTSTTTTSVSVKDGETVLINEVTQTRPKMNRRVIVLATARTLSD